MASPTRKKASNPPGVPAPIRGYYSNVVRVSSGPLLFVAGQVGMDARGTVPKDAAAQAELALKNIETILAAEGATLADVVKVTVYVTDMKYLDEITPARLKAFPKDGPASAIVQVGALALPELKVEIEAVAVAP
ncbi:MAG: RidA family protein [Candidatus Rokubacteria bacterium]|nr:RidA family protein [Candidatus Rokubacteria bacterium]